MEGNENDESDCGAMIVSMTNGRMEDLYHSLSKRMEEIGKRVNTDRKSVV